MSDNATDNATEFLENQKWMAGLRSDFIFLIVEGGDDVVAYRIVEDVPIAGSDEFIRRGEFVLVPRSHIERWLSKNPDVMISNHLSIALEIRAERKTE